MNSRAQLDLIVAMGMRNSRQTYQEFMNNTIEEAIVLAKSSEPEKLPVKALFSYDVLDAETREWARQEAVEIRQLSQGVAQQMVEIGNRLIAVQERLPKGAWMSWLHEEFAWRPRHAHILIRIAKTFGDVNLQGMLVSSGALRLLTFASLPPEVRRDAISTLHSQGSMSLHEAREIVRRVDPALAQTSENRTNTAKAREKDIGLRIAQELYSATRNLQVALAEAYGVPLRSPVSRALQRLFDLALALEDDQERKSFRPERKSFPTRKRYDATSRFWGVTWSKERKRWQARVTILGSGGKFVSPGSYDTEEEAARAYDAKARELYGDAARLNFPDEQ